MKQMISILVLALGFTAQAGRVEFLARLSPAGSFTAKTSDVTGSVKKMGNVFRSSDIVVKMDTFRTGIELRDRHMKDKLEVEKFPMQRIELRAEAWNERSFNPETVRKDDWSILGQVHLWL